MYDARLASPQRLRIAVLDDSPTDRDLARCVLSESFEVRTVARASELRALLGAVGPNAASWQPSVVLCDQDLITTTGEALFAELRNVLEAQGVAFVIYSALQSSGLTERVLDAGAAAVMVKPLEHERTIPMLRRVARQAAELRLLKQELRNQADLNHDLQMERLNATLPAPSVANELLMSTFIPQDRFEARLDQLLHTDPAQRHWGVVALEVRRFRALQSAHSPEVLSELLARIADTLRSCLPEPDLLCQPEPSLFLVAARLSSGSNAHEASLGLNQLSAHLVRQFEVPLEVLNTEIPVYLAAGASHGDLKIRASQLIREASHALQESNANPSSGQHHHLYSSALDQSHRLQTSLEGRLRKAIAREQIEPYYQPQVDVYSGQIIGAEALARWTEPDGTSISPAQFIPLAESAGLIVALSGLMQRKVAHHLRAWQTQLPKGFRIAVNISALEFAQSSFESDIQQVFASQGISNEFIELEITESAMISSIDVLRSLLARLSAKGFAVALDDFGTGYSALAVLHQLPLDRVKIDRAFVTPLSDPNKQAPIIDSVVKWGSTYGFHCLAEGVESEAQRNRVAQLGVTSAQGFLFGKAIPAGDFARSLLR